MCHCWAAVLLLIKCFCNFHVKEVGQFSPHKIENGSQYKIPKRRMN